MIVETRPRRPCRPRIQQRARPRPADLVGERCGQGKRHGGVARRERLVMRERLEGVLGGGLVRTQPAGDDLAASRDHSREHDGCQHADATALQVFVTADEPGRQQGRGNTENDLRLPSIPERARERVAVRGAAVLDPRVDAPVERADTTDHPGGDGHVPPPNGGWGRWRGTLSRRARGGGGPTGKDDAQRRAAGGVSPSTAATSIVMRTSSPTICAPSMKRFKEMPYS